VTLKTYWPLGIGVEIDRPGKATELRWTHTDRLGSPIALSDEAGLVQEELAYDPWGKRRDPVSHATPDTLDGKIDNKGFTNHEMLDQLDLVHMNGRVYDPFVARFLSGDPVIQDPTNGQNYDRYSYVFNNPTNFTDPTGFSCADGRDGMEACRGMSLSPQNFNDASTLASKAWQKEDAAARANASSGRPVNANNTRTADGKNKGGQSSANDSGVVAEGTIKYGPNAVPVSEYTEKVLRDNMGNANVTSITITSTYRDPSDQARVMFENWKHMVLQNRKSYMVKMGAMLLRHIPVLEKKEWIGMES